ncbi:MAG: ABC transporter ATP-binding protein [Magnetococcales bacterium]|nr:ABC transporter ATP-binding protein [Magnetococcales bacterium]
MVRVEQLTHVYPARRKQPPRLALDRLDLTVAEGTFFVLTGPNGGGKSTLFRILCGLMRPSAGRVLIRGLDLLRESAAARSAMGVVFQKPALDVHLSVEENFKIHADLYGVAPSDYRRRLDEGLSWTGLADRLNHRVGSLSGGLARQVELVKALLHNPSLLIMDEPSTGLDPGTRRGFVDMVRRIQRERGMTVLMTSHIFSEAEEADAVAILKEGRLLARESPARLRASLGRELLVIQTTGAAPLAAELAVRPGLKVQTREGEVRVEGPDMTALVQEIFLNRPEGIRAISLKEPSLEDVYIHLTGRSLEQEESEGTRLSGGGAP